MPDKRPANSELPAKFSQIPVSPSGQSRMTRISGKTSAVETEMIEAGRDFSMASI